MSCGGVIEIAILKDAILSLGLGCCCLSLLSSMTMSFREFRSGTPRWIHGL